MSKAKKIKLLKKFVRIIYTLFTCLHYNYIIICKGLKFLIPTKFKLYMKHSFNLTFDMNISEIEMFRKIASLIIILIIFI